MQRENRLRQKHQTAWGKGTAESWYLTPSQNSKVTLVLSTYHPVTSEHRHWHKSPCHQWTQTLTQITLSPVNTDAGTNHLVTSEQTLTQITLLRVNTDTDTNHPVTSEHWHKLPCHQWTLTQITLSPVNTDIDTNYPVTSEHRHWHKDM